MTKLKMGMHNTITAERFHIIKAALAEGMGEEAVMAKYGIKKTTLKYIEKSNNFYEYHLRTETLPAARKMPKVIAPSSGLEFEDFSYKRPKQSKITAERRASREDESGARVVGIVAILGIAIIGLVALYVLATLWNTKN